MRSTVNIDDDVAKDLMRLTRGKTKTAAINLAVADWVRLKRLQEIRSLRGKLEVADDLARLRAQEKGTR
jgi:Arc/MetJ family transcription regulator